MTWKCPKCKREFRRENQRHACGSGDRAVILRDRPASLVKLYSQLEGMVKRLAGADIVTRDRYALFRTTRIFTDLTVMKDALRVVIHLDRAVREPFFVKVGRSGKRVSHVAMVRTAAELRTITPLVREAYQVARAETAGR